MSLLLHYQGLFDNLPDLVMLVDDQGHVLEANAPARELLGLVTGEPTPLADLVSDSHVGMVLEALHRGETLRYQANLVDLDGQKVGVDVHQRRTERGTVLAARLIGNAGIDQQIARLMETRYRIVAENTYEWEFWLSPHGHFLYSSPSCRRITGYDASDFEDDPALLPGLVLKEDRECFWGVWGPEGWRDGVNRCTFQVRHRDGGTRWLEHTSQKVYDNLGNYVGLRGSHRDVTEQRLAQAERERIQEQLLQAQKMEAVGTLAGGLAHDFNNLLSCVLGFASLAKLDLERGSEAFEALDVIEQAGRRAADLTRQLLGFARRGKVQHGPTSIRSTVEEVVQLLSRTIDKQIRLDQVHLSEHDQVLGDPAQLQQVLLNLAINARDAIGARPGRICFTTELCGDQVRIDVSDDGSGIAPHDLERIFEPFYTTKDPGYGTGMGLAMVYGIVHNHGGTIEVKSTLGQGTVFSLYLPRSEGNGDCVVASVRELPRGTGRVLVADDEPLLRATLERMLKQLGYETVLTCDGQEASEYYQHHAADIDLVILDVIMPVMGGVACYHRLRSVNPNTRVLLSTGFCPDGQVQELLQHEGVSLIQKPYQLDALADAVSKAFTGV